MKNVMKLGSFEAAVVMTDDAVVRMGTLGVIGGGLLALASLMF